MIEALVSQAEAQGGQPLALPEDFTTLAANEQAQHTKGFREQRFGAKLKWSQSQPPSPQMPGEIRYKVLALVGKEMRERVKLCKQQGQAKRKANAAIYGMDHPDAQYSEAALEDSIATADSRGSKKRATELRVTIEGEANEMADFAPISTSQGAPSSAMKNQLQVIEPGTPVVAKVESVRPISPSQPCLTGFNDLPAFQAKSPSVLGASGIADQVSTSERPLVQKSWWLSRLLSSA